MDHISIAREAMVAQSDAVRKIAHSLGAEYQNCVQAVLSCQGGVIISGMGKSGLIGRKIAATLASTGTPSFFMHPAEAYHGDLGMITSSDIVFLLSYSGETEEVIRLIPVLKAFGNIIVAIAGNKNSTLARNADIYLDVEVEREVCPNNLAPTTSTLATMAMGDALAVSLIRARGFEPTDFARFHPGGSLGRKLLTRVKDVMHAEVPYVTPTTPLHECLMVMTAGRIGIVIVVENDQLKGIITDGDIRRGLLKDPGGLVKPAKDFMTSSPITVEENVLLAEAEKIMKERKVRILLVRGSEAGDIVGAIEIFD
ncbi:KpsF/GutQ family sugar-phosphate isomerase [Billgrantia aerodenitrificans]|uniref:Arabinose 5-phosphate isomerase n=1 Tax=Billgrantia aerodenitrificans TaxID=2733483 RepID=A0ABS9AYH5_9GAMM|nr:KpsF/GutQ family sugar-phosphate isomerase [Halomonas aerodenitrificans]MCE8026968.1 KpsF/GutQ family sugar-phosphate isomerase [Halomonas aerodenitrificans]